MSEKGSVLVVDDTEASLRVLSDLLKQEGYSVRAALSAEWALRSAAHHPPDLVLMDIRMPDLDGFEACRRLKSDPATREVPVIFISALAETYDKVRGFGSGAVDYVTKPYQREELLARVATHVKLRIMQRQMSAQNEELRHYRERLEELVARRTAELRASNRQLGLVNFALDQVREAAYLIDAEGRFRYVNQEACRAHGYSAEELCRLGVPQIDADCSRQRFESFWNEVAHKGVATFETTHRRRDGSTFPVEITASQIEYQGSVLQLALARDISERKEAERCLRESYALLQELTSRRESAREEERKRMAQEIHDELGQHLTALRIGIGTVRYLFARENHELTEQLLELSAQTDHTIQVVRNIATALRPSALDRGVGPALEWLAAQFQSSTGIACGVTLPVEPCPLTEEPAMALFRIVQESLTNVARHAEATSVAIALGWDGSCCRLTIRDDGQGFDLLAKRANSFGLLGMRERALMLGGDLIIDTAPGKGTSLQVVIPLQTSP